MAKTVVDVEMLDLFKTELELCKVKKGEVVAVLSGGNDHPEYAQTLYARGAESRCHYFSRECSGNTANRRLLVCRGATP